MKKFASIIKVVVLAGFIALVLLPTINFAARDEGGKARDPHMHMGDITRCFNEVYQKCGSEG